MIVIAATWLHMCIVIIGAKVEGILTQRFDIPVTDVASQAARATLIITGSSSTGINLYAIENIARGAAWAA